MLNPPHSRHPAALLRWTLALLLGAAALPGQMVPNAPIEDFTFPVFGEDGYKAWELSGAEGRYINRSESEVIGLDLKVFSQDERMLLETRIRSPKARIFIDRSYAEGPSSIFVSGPSFIVEGANWFWDGKAERIVIREDVRVTFNDKIEILK